MSVKLTEQQAAVIRLLQKDSSLPQKQIAFRVGVSTTRLNKIISKLSDLGVFLKRSVAILSPDVLGIDQVGFMQIHLSGAKEVWSAAQIIRTWPEVMEVHLLYSNMNELLLKVRARHSSEFTECERKVRELPGVKAARTQLVMPLKETMELPI